MAESLRSISERVDELPVVLAQRARMGVQPLLDAQFPTHGNWVGLSLDGVTVVWLPQIVSEADPRLHHGAPWTEPRLHTRRGYTGPPVPPLDMGDDRLAGGLEALSDEAGWALLERALNRQLLRVSDLQPEGVRRDSTTARGHGTVSEDGLCQCGHRKEHRPDLPQVQVRLSALEPVGWPVATDVGPGQRADAPLAVPAILRVRESLGRWGGLDGGHGQRGAVETRAFIPAGGDAYLGPRSAVQRPPDVVASSLVPVWTGQPLWTRVT